MGLASIVGENGPELFVPSIPGQIVSNDDLRSMSGGGGTTIIVNVSGIDFSNPAALRPIAEQIGNEVMRSIRVRTGLGKVM